MSLLGVDKVIFDDDTLDGLIRWALRDSVTGAEPSSQVWERIQQGARGDTKAIGSFPSARRNLPWRRSWLRWLVGAGAKYPIPGDPRSAWQRRLHAFDMWAPLSVVCIVEGKMPVLRLIS